MRPELVKKSKFLSLILRHDPAAVGVELDEAGWIEVETLLAALQRKDASFSRACLEEIVATNDKRRFALSDDGSKIRASQGHSLGIDLGLAPTAPPPELFHGTAGQHLASIRENGLRRGTRDQVHLSADAATAKTVGGRHGRPVVLVVHAAAMAEAGYPFYLSDNGVWLTKIVPAAFIRFPE